MSKYKTEFPDYDDTLWFHLRTLQTYGHFEDVSYHNDCCPLFQNDKLKLRIWIDYRERDKRESNSRHRYAVQSAMNELGDWKDEGDYDDWYEVVEKVREHYARQS